MHFILNIARFNNLWNEPDPISVNIVIKDQYRRRVHLLIKQSDDNIYFCDSLS